MFIGTKELENTTRAFEQNFILRNELGASLSVWQNGEEILSLADGRADRESGKAWTEKTLIPIYSATKGPAAAVFLMLLEQNGLTPQNKVIDIWPKFPIKQATYADVLSHRCGLAAIDAYVSVFEFDAVIDAIQSQSANWDFGSAHGYHPRTLGFILDKISQNLTNEKIGTNFERLIARPLDLDLWIGLPDEQFTRVATLYPGKMNKSDLESGFYKDFNTAGTLVRKTFSSPRGLQSVHEMNSPKAWKLGLPAMGGIATATALAKFYQAAIGEIPLFSESIRQSIATPIVAGNDLILRTATKFSCGFQFDPIDSFGQKTRRHYGISQRAFGHPGAGGSHGFADPDSSISLAYTMNQMELSVLPNEKCLSLIQALYGG